MNLEYNPFALDYYSNQGIRGIVNGNYTYLRDPRSRPKRIIRIIL